MADKLPIPPLLKSEESEKEQINQLSSYLLQLTNAIQIFMDSVTNKEPEKNENGAVQEIGLKDNNIVIVKNKSTQFLPLYDYLRTAIYKDGILTISKSGSSTSVSIPSTNCFKNFSLGEEGVLTFTRDNGNTKAVNLPWYNFDGSKSIGIFKYNSFLIQYGTATIDCQTLNDTQGIGKVINVYKGSKTVNFISPVFTKSPYITTSIVSGYPDGNINVTHSCTTTQATFHVIRTTPGTIEIHWIAMGR